MRSESKTTMKTGLRNSFIVLIALCCCHGIVSETDVSGAQIGPDPAIQVKIGELLRLAPRPDRRGLTKESFGEALRALRRSVDNDGALLIPQIVFYQLSSTDERETWDCEFLLEELSRDLSKSEILNAVAPYLRTENQKARRRLTEIVGVVCRGEAGIDFQPIFDLMVERKGEVQEELIEFMFAVSPGDALLHYMRYRQTTRTDLLERKNILLAEHIIGDTLWKQEYGFLEPHAVEPAAVEKMQMLSQHQDWSVRLYVAEIMRQHAGFRRPKIVERLKEDSSPFVRKTMSFLQGEKSE